MRKQRGLEEKLQLLRQQRKKRIVFFLKIRKERQRE
jgi:hypothetical protein